MTDRKRIHGELRQTNVELLEQCIRDAHRIAAAFFNGGHSDQTVALIAAQLFDKLANKQYSEEQRVLT